MNVDSGQDIVDTGTGDIKFRQKFDLSTRDAGINAQFLGNSDEILLQNLIRQHTRTCTAMVRD